MASNVNVMRTVRFIGFGIICLITLWYFISPNINASSKIPVTQLATVLEQKGTPLSPFNLIDSDGNHFSEKSLRGHWSLMFFGYTTCPDVCPTTLSVVSEAWNGFNGKYPAKFIFASINPIDDDPKSLKFFLRNFHNDFIGVTGPSQEIAKLSQQLNVIAQKHTDNETGTTIIDHTAALMLIDPRGRLKAVFTPPLDANAIINDLNAITA
ncbi:MAG: SCO family protein [Francisellaceae bacterium]|jgi:protein SCO1|nr:SCO family protein [Francisellaceae bacterium]MBT6538239.1 SCO family protein [Francisellaceae bacterium]